MSRPYASLLSDDSPENDNPEDNHKLRDHPSSSFSSLWSPPSMWSWNYCGLYAQYAAVGLVYGSMSVSYNFCVYYYDGPTNLCANAKNIQMLAWRCASSPPASNLLAILRISCPLASKSYSQFSQIAIVHLDSDERSLPLLPFISPLPAIHRHRMAVSNRTAHVSFSHCQSTECISMDNDDDGSQHVCATGRCSC